MNTKTIFKHLHEIQFQAEDMDWGIEEKDFKRLKLNQKIIESKVYEVVQLLTPTMNSYQKFKQAGVTDEQLSHLTEIWK